MRMLAPVMEIPTLAMFHPREDLPFRRAVALEFICNEHPWHILQPFEQLAKKLLCGLLVAAALHQDIEHVVVLIDSAPEVMALSVDGQKHLIQVPFIPGLRATPTQAIGILLPKLSTPLTDSFMGYNDATLEQEFLHVAVAQGEAIVEPNPVANDFVGKAVVLVARRVGQRGHA
jgi:hypothetical protein